VGEVYVATPVLEEVREIDAAMAVSLGIKLFEPSLEILAQAASVRGRLSFQDRVCLLVAKAREEPDRPGFLPVICHHI
jgi:hypothetical protein